MKKLFLLTITAMLFGINAFSQSITKPFTVTDFQGLNVSGTFDVELSKSAVPSVIVIADKDVMPYIIVKVERGILSLSLDGFHPNKIKIGPIKAKVTIKGELESLTVSGASKFYTNNTFAPQSFTAQISGASCVDMGIDSKTAKVNVSGASRMTIKGTVSEGDYEVSGASDVEINQDLSKLDLECSGAVKVKFNGKAKAISSECSGAAYLKMAGECSNMETEVSGASKLDALGLKVSQMDIEVTGVSAASIYVEGTLDAEVSGGSSLQYKGTPQIRSKEVSSISSFKKIN